MIADIRDYIKSHLLYPLKQYPTIMQDTLVELITEKLEELYTLTIRFPEILSPNQSRLDILKIIADQFLFTIREDADLQEQIDILNNILYVYSKRGSIDTIENMWKYYGGSLPKDVKVIIPSYNLFRYSVSSFSGNHVFVDTKIENGKNTGKYRPYTFEIQLTNNYYPLDKLKEFLIKELVPAGTEIYFSTIINFDLLGSLENSNHYDYKVYDHRLIEYSSEVLKKDQRFSWSRYGNLDGLDKLSGNPDIYMSIIMMLNSYITYSITLADIDISHQRIADIAKYAIKVIRTSRFSSYYELLHCTMKINNNDIDISLYSRDGERIPYRYPGYFTLSDTLLGEEVI